MGILDTLASRLGYFKAKGDPRPPGEMLSIADGFRWDMPLAEDAERQMRLYAQLTWISTAIDRTAEIAAGGKFQVYKVAGEPGGADDEEVPNHEFEKLLHKPNPSQSRGEFLRDAFTMFRITGNLYVFLNSLNENAPPDELWLVPSHMIRPIPDGRSYVAGYEFVAPGKTPEFIPAWKIVHMKTSNPMNPFVGLSAVQSLALDAFGDLAQQKWNLAHFDRNNAKLPTILAFKHMVADPEWSKIKGERDREWGGTNRSGVTLLRGVGDSLQLLQASATQKDMEFLASRNFTKEEIYGKLAPGLASILAVNATEANAIAGKSTLIEFGVWPVLVQMAEKFSATILPLYGDENVRGEFEDMRISNRILDLEEQAAYERSHTINEVRAEYYDEDPLYMTEEQAAAMEQEQAEADEQKELAIAQLNGEVGKPKPKPFGKAEEMPTDKPTTPEGAKGKKLDPRGLMFVAQVGPATPTPGQKQPVSPLPVKPGAPPPDKQEPGDKEQAKDDQRAELKAWENYALKRLGKAGAREFTPRVIDVWTATRISTALKTAATPADVRRVFASETQDQYALLSDAVEELRRHNDKLGA